MKGEGDATFKELEQTRCLPDLFTIKRIYLALAARVMRLKYFDDYSLRILHSIAQVCI